MSYICPNHKDRKGEYTAERMVECVWEVVLVCDECKASMKDQVKPAQCLRHPLSAVETDKFGNLCNKCIKGHLWNEECEVRDAQGKRID